jgi:hypothetical protein
MVGFGKLLVVIGIAFIATGWFFWSGASMPLVGRLGRLPGDIFIRRGSFTFYFPLTSSIVLSIVLSLILLLLRR